MPRTKAEYQVALAKVVPKAYTDMPEGAAWNQRVAAMFEAWELNLQSYWRTALLEYSVGSQLDRHGRDIAKDRIPQESDENYRERLRKTILDYTLPELIAAIEDIVGVSVYYSEDPFGGFYCADSFVGEGIIYTTGVHYLFVQIPKSAFEVDYSQEYRFALTEEDVDTFWVGEGFADGFIEDEKLQQLSAVQILSKAMGVNIIYNLS